MRIVDPIISELEREAETTKRVLERVPNDKLNWRPHAKSMPLGQLAQHVATTPGGVASIGYLLFIQIFVRNVILRHFMRSDFSLIGVRVFYSTNHLGLEWIAFLQQLGDAF